MHTSIHALRKRVRSIAVAIAASSMVLGNVASVSAATLSSASLSLGDPRPGETSTYTYDASGFTTGTSIECIQIVLNDASDGTGSVPSAITTTSSTLDSSSLITAGSWSVDNGVNGTLEITNSGGETPNASGDVVFGNITNGDTDGTTYYALFTSYTDDACTGGNEVDQKTVAFVYKDGELVTLTIDPTLTFVCNAVGTSASVNGDTTTHASTASGIDYDNDVTASQNGISAHDLAVTTNASGGYTVSIRHTGDLQNLDGDTITTHTGTNASPSPFPAAGTEAWGYTTEDATLSAIGDGVDRFTTPAGDYAGFTTSNEEVIANTAAVPGTETTRVGHQVGVASTTEAGTYQTTIVYTVVATF